ncbi:unnamed protein product [Thelazia callipaeda]|uniref:SPAR_C domain-containing protein n=1 Tax=Thelazia callipaeda TaxID=103827 RepID=A0A0N5CL78_THECL|nr:unnamed protein product [Thelazia callipaeda]
MATPPVPPPPPPLQSTSPFLSSGWRSPTNSNRQARSTVSTTLKSSAPWLDAKTLQHAAAGLRKTEHNRPLQCNFENLSDGRVDGSDQQLFRHHRQNDSFHAPVETNQARTSFYASPLSSYKSLPVSNGHQYTDTLTKSKYTERPSFSPQNIMSTSYSSSSKQYSSTQNESSNNYVIPKDSPYIKDPKSYIRAYATQTPTYTVMDSNSNVHQNILSNRFNVDKRMSDINANKAHTFVKDLRDQSLTQTQRVANQFQQSLLRDVPPPQSMESLYEQKKNLGSDQIDALIRDMEWKMKTGVGAAGEC